MSRSRRGQRWSFAPERSLTEHISASRPPSDRCSPPASPVFEQEDAKDVNESGDDSGDDCLMEAVLNVCKLYSGVIIGQTSEK